nr:FecR domain-containing protein [Sphingomonas sp. Y57]
MTPEERQGQIREKAAEWHVRIDSDAMDWEGFAAWLDADPAHRATYDGVALLDDEIVAGREAIRAAQPANDVAAIERTDTPPGSHRRRWWAGGGLVAAAGLAILAMPQLRLPSTAAAVVYRTGPGETRSIGLRGGSRIVIDRNSELALRDGDTPEVDMRGGSAYFDIRHEPGRAMVIRAGEYEVRDIGTRFDLVRTPDHLAVAVADGQVTIAEPGREGLLLSGGQRVDIAGRGGEATIRRQDAGDVASWRDGRLVYDNAPLALVAVDLSRYAGRAVSVDPAVAGLRVSGVLTIGDGSRLVGQIEALLPVKATVEDHRIRLVGTL